MVSVDGLARWRLRWMVVVGDGRNERLSFCLMWKVEGKGCVRWIEGWRNGGGGGDGCKCLVDGRVWRSN